MSDDDTYGRDVFRRDMTLYRDAPFADCVKRHTMTTAELVFPALTPVRRWTAAVAPDPADPTLQRATWVEPANETMSIPVDTRVELWLDGEAITYGKVQRRGSLPG